MELESLSCIVSCLRPTYTLFSCRRKKKKFYIYIYIMDFIPCSGVTPCQKGVS